MAQFSDFHKTTKKKASTGTEQTRQGKQMGLGNEGKVTQNCRKNQHEFDLLEVRSVLESGVSCCVVPHLKRE